MDGADGSIRIVRAAGRWFAYTNRSMTARGGATRSWWWIAILLAGCVQHRDQQPGGTFGRYRSDLFAERVAPDAALASGVGHADVGTAGSEVASTDGLATKVPAENRRAAAAEVNPEQVDPSALAAPTSTSTTPANSHPVAAGAASRGRSERHLRNAFATADQNGVTQAALDLAGYLAQQERHFDALFVVDAALQRQHTTPLRLARAGLLRDVARCDLAAIELQGVVRQLGAKNVSPATLFDLVQAEWVDGQAEAAAATLRSIQHGHAGDAWLRDHAIDMSEWDLKIRDVPPGRDPLANGELRDLFALLRAAPDAAGRLTMLNTLAAPPKSRAIEPDDIDARRPIRVRAIAIACADESTAVRARAVYLAAANQITDERFWQVALTDSAPLVRRFAATGAAQQHGRTAGSILLEAISREQDEQTFESLHAALAIALSVTAPACTAESAAGRIRAIAHWKSQCEQ